MLACANNHIFSLIQLHYLFWLYHTPIKANIILGFMALFALRYQYVEIIVCWEIKLHYCVSFSCLINNDGWLLFSSPPATILSSSPLQVKNERINKEIKGESEEPGAIQTRRFLSLKFHCLIKVANCTYKPDRHPKSQHATVLSINRSIDRHTCWYDE